MKAAPQLQLSVFQGPLDLLLHLIEKRDLDITKVSLIEVTGQYLDYLHSADSIDVEALAEFIVIAARLIWLKSSSLLPQPPSFPDSKEEDTGEELVQLLVEYKRFKAAAEQLKEIEERGLKSYPRLAPAFAPVVSSGLAEVTLEQLLEALKAALSRRPQEPQATIEVEAIKISDKMVEIEETVRKVGSLSFSLLLERCSTRRQMIVSFLALLELIKACRVVVRQEQLFGEILILLLDPNQGNVQPVEP